MLLGEISSANLVWVDILQRLLSFSQDFSCSFPICVDFEPIQLLPSVLHCLGKRSFDAQRIQLFLPVCTPIPLTDP